MADSQSLISAGCEPVEWREGELLSLTSHPTVLKTVLSLDHSSVLGFVS